jgi:hypothetical protein
VSKGNDESRHRHGVQELLLAHLLAANAPHWPGGDALTLDAVLRSYPQAAADGLVPDLLTLQRRHPELAGLLKDFFDV